MAKMITTKFGYVSPIEAHCLGDLERDLKKDRRWKERIKNEKDTTGAPVRHGDLEPSSNRKHG